MKVAIWIIAAALVVLAAPVALQLVNGAADASHMTDAEQRAIFAAVADAL